MLMAVRASEVLDCCAGPGPEPDGSVPSASVKAMEADLFSDPFVETAHSQLTPKKVDMAQNESSQGIGIFDLDEIFAKEDIGSGEKIEEELRGGSCDSEESRLDWRAKAHALSRAFLNRGDEDTPSLTPMSHAVEPEDFKREFNWLLCIVFPQGTRENITITKEQAQAFYEQNFFPEEIVIAGQLLTAKTMEMETRAFLHAFAELPGPSPTEKWYERPIGCGTPQSFMELVRNAIVVKLESHAGLIVRSCFSRDRHYVYMLVTSGLDGLVREAEKSKMQTELSLRVVDPLTLEPCTVTNIPLATWFTKHCFDPDVQRKLKELVTSLKQDDRQRFPQLGQHYTRAANHKPLVHSTTDASSLAYSLAGSMRRPGEERSAHSPLSRGVTRNFTFKDKAAVRRAGYIFQEDHVGGEASQRQVKDAYLRYLDARKAEGLTARGDNLIAKAIAMDRNKPALGFASPNFHLPNFVSEVGRENIEFRIAEGGSLQSD